MWLGEHAVGATLYFTFTTRRFTTGAPFALAGGVIRIYKDATDVEDDSGITLTADFDSRTGLNLVTIDTSTDGTFYSAGGQFHVVITVGTVDSVSVVGETVGRFKLLAAEGDISDVLSRLVVTNSQLLIVKSDTSDIKSHLVVIQSETTAIQSDTTTLASDLAEGDFSDILSRLTVMQAVISDIQSDTNVMVPIVSDIQSDTSDIQSKLVALALVASDIQSDTNVMVPVVSDIRSQTVRIHSDTISLASDLAEGDFSDILSRLTIIASDTLHIESQVVRIHSDTITLASDLAEGDFSDILSRLTVTNSQLLIVKSDTSDIKSALVIVVSDTTAIHTLATKIDSDQASQFVIIEENTSDTESALVKVYSDTTAIEIATAGGALTAAQDSKLTQIHSDQASQFVVLEQNTSDTESALVKVYSDTTAIEIATAGGALTAAQDSKLTQIHSDQASQFVVLEQNTSDTESMLVLIRSDTAVIESVTSDIQSDTSDIQSKLVALAAVASDIQSDTNVLITVTSDIQSDTNKLVSDATEVDTSDILSLLTLVRSDTTAIEIATAGGALTAAQDSKLTQIHSDQASQFTILEQNTSDTESALVKVYSDTTVVESRLNELDTSDIGSLLARVYSDTTLATAAAGEPAQGAPPASADRMTKIDYLYKAWRNKTEQTATTYSLYDDAGTTVDHKASVSDDATTFTRDEVGTGP